MTLKEKAISLYQSFYPQVQWKMGQEDCKDRAKQCALIAVDEIYKLRMTRGQHLEYDLDKINYYSYWEEVRQEIYKLWQK